MPVLTNDNYLPLAGYPVLSTTSIALCELLEVRLAQKRKLALAFANTNFVMRCQALRPWLCSDEVAVVNDGIGMDIAALLKYGKKFEENLNGTDFVPRFIQQLKRPAKIFLLGGQVGVAVSAAKVIEHQLGQEVVGIQDGYTPIAQDALRAAIDLSEANIVLVALGNPIQEEWIRANMHALNATLFVSVGALFDFLSGGVARAPRWVQRLRLEWLFRLLREPRRMARRYSIDVVRFLLLCRRYPQRLVGNLDAQATVP